MNNNTPESPLTRAMVARALIQAVTRRLLQSTTSPSVNTVFTKLVDDALNAGLLELPNHSEAEIATVVLDLLTEWSDDSDMQIWTEVHTTDYTQRTRQVTYQLISMEELAAESPFCPFSPYTGELAEGSFFLFLLNGYLMFEDSNPAMTIFTMHQEMALREGNVALVGV